MIRSFQTFTEGIFEPRNMSSREKKANQIKEQQLQKFGTLIKQFKDYLESLNLYNVELQWDNISPMLLFVSKGLIDKSSVLGHLHAGEKAIYTIIFDEEISVTLENNGYSTTIESLEDLKNLVPTDGFVRR